MESYKIQNYIQNLNLIQNKNCSFLKPNFLIVLHSYTGINSKFSKEYYKI